MDIEMFSKNGTIYNFSKWMVMYIRKIGWKMQ